MTTDHPASGRFDVHSTGELSGSFDSAEERARLLQAVNADRDLCSALLCGERQLLCRGVDWERAQAFVALMRECGVVTQVVRHGEVINAAGDDGIAVEWPDGVELASIAEPLASGAGEADAAPNPAVAGARGAALDGELITVADCEPASAPGDGRHAGHSAKRPRQQAVFDAELVVEPTVAPRAVVRPETVVSDGGGDIPLYLLEADARERHERRRLQRRWGIASLVVLAVALIAAFSGGEESYSSSQAYVHLLASALPASVDGVVAEVLVQPGQSLQRGEAVAVIAPTAGDGGATQRQIEVTSEAGLVDWVGIRVGQRMQRGDPLLTLALPGSAYLLAYFPPEQRRELPPRAMVQIELDDYPGNTLLGRVVEGGNDGVASGNKARSAVRIAFEAQPPLPQRLHSGMAASVTIRRPADE